MTEQPGSPFLQSPTIPGRPQSRQFIFREARTHADSGVVPGDAVAAAAAFKIVDALLATSQVSLSATTLPV